MEGQWLGKGFGVGVGEQYRTSGMLQHRILATEYGDRYIAVITQYMQS